MASKNAVRGSSAGQPSASALGWWAAVALCAALTLIGVHLANRYLHGVLVGSSDAVHSLRLLTWNIGKIYLPVDSRAADRDLDHVARVIREIDPHVVALQELKGPRQLGRLLAALGPRWRGRIPEDAYDRRPALLTRLPARFIEFKTSTGRAAQGAEVTLSDSARVTVTSLHLDAFDPERRIRQAEEIVASARRLGLDEIFLAGDFNFDPAEVMRDSADHYLYLFLTAELIDAAKDQGGTTLVSRRLDYVFYGSDRIERVRSEVLIGRRINIMDHDPLLVEFDRRAGAR